MFKTGHFRWVEELCKPMSLFGKLVSTAINVVTLPVAVAKDVVTLGNFGSNRGSYTVQKLEQTKREAQ